MHLKINTDQLVGYIRVSIVGVKNLCPMFKTLVCQFRIYSPKKHALKFIIYHNSVINSFIFSISEHAKLSSVH